ncbi:MAG: tyrosine-type recombinase/integrase [Devosia sp.]
MATVTKRKWSNKSGAHEAWVLAFTDTAGKRHKEQFPTKRAADARRVEVEGLVSKGAYREQANKHSVADAVDRYLTHLQARHDRGERVTATYLNTTRAELENYVVCVHRDEAGLKFRQHRVTDFRDGIGHIRLAHLTPGDVSDLAERLRNAGVSVTTTRRAIAALSRALSYAVSKNLAGTNPAKGLRIVGTREDGPKKIVPPTKEQMQRLIKAADADLRVRIQFAATSGLRASEQWALRWRHIDLDAGEVMVESRVDIFGVEDTTKSAAGKRTVPIGKPVVEMLRAYRGDAKPDDLVFPVVIKRKRPDRITFTFTRHGNLLRRHFQPLLKRIELPQLGWHALRHFAVSLWIEDGRPPKTVQTWAGHATLAITMDRYGHLFPSEDHKKAADRIAESVFM